jgi:hypothetical protein
MTVKDKVLEELKEMKMTYKRIKCKDCPNQIKGFVHRDGNIDDVCIYSLKSGVPKCPLIPIEEIAIDLTEKLVRAECEKGSLSQEQLTKEFEAISRSQMAAIKCERNRIAEKVKEHFKDHLMATKEDVLKIVEVKG